MNISEIIKRYITDPREAFTIPCAVGESVA